MPGYEPNPGSSLGNKATPVLVPTNGPETCALSVPDQGRGTPARRAMREPSDGYGSDTRSRSGRVSAYGPGGIRPSSCADALVCRGYPALQRRLTWQAGAAQPRAPRSNT